MIIMTAKITAEELDNLTSSAEESKKKIEELRQKIEEFKISKQKTK